MKKSFLLFVVLIPALVLTGCVSIKKTKKNTTTLPPAATSTVVSTGTLNTFPTATATNEVSATTDSDDAENNSSGIVYKTMSATEYKKSIDLKAAEVARAKMFNPVVSVSGQIDADNEIKDVKNNCNLAIDAAATIPADLSKKIKQGFICRYVKGSVNNNTRIDEFTIKFIGTVPFEFGVDGNLNFNTSFGSLVLNKKAAASLVEEQANITTIAGEVHFNNSVSGNIGSTGAAAGSKTNTTTKVVVSNPSQLAEANSNAVIYLAILGDGGKQGKAVGCGDSLVPVKVHVDFASTKTDQKIRDTLQKLFSLRSRIYNKDLGLINPLYNSTLSISSLTISGSLAVVELQGEFNLDGACDQPIVEAQIKNLILQFKPITSVELRINTPGQDDVF